jgi:hypothetical protein
MLIVRLKLKIMATEPPQKSPGTHSITPVESPRMAEFADIEERKVQQVDLTIKLCFSSNICMSLD